MTDREAGGNSISGNVTGPVVQVETLHGGIHQHWHEGSSEQIAQLGKSLTEVRQDLHQAHQDRTRLADLAVFLTKAIHQLQIQQDRIRDERNTLLTSNTLQRADGQITRAERQRTRTTDELARLTVLITDLRDRLDILTARLPGPPEPAASTKTVSPPHIAQTLNLDDAEAVLDNVDDVLKAASDNSARSRRHLNSIVLPDDRRPGPPVPPAARPQRRKASIWLTAPFIVVPAFALLTSSLASPKTQQTGPERELPASVTVLSPEPAQLVPHKGRITIKASNVRSGQYPWVYLRGFNVPDVWPQNCESRVDAREIFDCDVWYGYEDKSRNKQFQITAVVVDQEGNLALANLQRRNGGGGESFHEDQPPTQPLAQSDDVVVKRI